MQANFLLILNHLFYWFLKWGQIKFSATLFVIFFIKFFQSLFWVFILDVDIIVPVYSDLFLIIILPSLKLIDDILLVQILSRIMFSDSFDALFEAQLFIDGIFPVVEDVRSAVQTLQFVIHDIDFPQNHFRN